MPHMGMDQIDTIFGGDEHPEIHRDEIHIYIYHIAILVPFAMFVWLVIDLPL